MVSISNENTSLLNRALWAIILCLLLPWANLRWNNADFLFHLPRPSRPTISSTPWWMKWETSILKWDFFLEGSNVAELEVLWASYMMVGWFPDTWGGSLSLGTDPNLCFVTYIVDPEVSTGPVVLLFLRDHLHSDVSVSYGFFCEWPVMVTFHLRGQEQSFQTNRPGKK